MTYEERIEAVARAICKVAFRADEDGHVPYGTPDWRDYVAQARAADPVWLAATKEPTEEMIAASMGALESHPVHHDALPLHRHKMQKRWRSMHAAIQRGEPS